jgi:hypothetical protein
VQDHLAAAGRTANCGRIEDAPTHKVDLVPDRLEPGSGTRGHVVDDGYLMTGGQQRVDQVVADEAGAASDEDPQESLLEVVEDPVDRDGRPSIAADAARRR